MDWQRFGQACPCLADVPPADAVSVHEFCYTPAEWERLYNCHRGAVFGLSHPFMQLGYFRPQNKHPR